MDLGISGKRALVCAASRGLGRGCAEALAAEGVSLVLNARGGCALEATAEHIRATHGVSVTTVKGDVTDPEIQQALADASDGADILVTNAGGPPPGDWTTWSRADFIKAFDANMFAAVALMQALVPPMAERGWGRVVNITSQAVRSPIPVLGLSNTARCGLTGFVAGMSRQVAGQGVCVNNLLPGLHDTDRAASLDRAMAQKDGIEPEEARAQRQATIPAGRYGSPDEFGAACAFLCSQQAGFIVGQNLLLDGGQVALTM